MQRSSLSSPTALSRWSAFTLIEMLVVVGILLILAAMTASVVNVAMNGDRTRGAARQVQSYLEGARGRAIYGGKQKGSGYQCGVRFLRDPNDLTLVTSLQFVENDPSTTTISGGVISLARLDVNNDDVADTPNGDVLRMIGNTSGGNASTNWLPRYALGLIFDFQTVELGGRKYQIDTTPLASGIEEILLRTAYAGSLDPSVTPTTEIVVTPPRSPEYKLLLPPQPMPNQEPRVLGNGVVIDLKTQAINGVEMSKGINALINQNLPIDIMFSPRGTVVGPLSGTGIVVLAISDREDSLKNIPLPSTSTPNPAPKRERLLVSLTPQTGKAAVHPVFIDPTGTTIDPFRYAETGEVAQQ